jgi:peptide/nickel transport system permease protein
MILPTVVLSTLMIGLVARITRSSVLEVLRQDYVRTARASGIRESLVYGKYVLKNALIPVITVIGITFGLSMGGAVVVEQVFSLPGIGRLVVSAVQGRDYPVIQGALLITALLFVLINLVVDIIYAWVDPRVKYDTDR